MKPRDSTHRHSGLHESTSLHWRRRLLEVPREDEAEERRDIVAVEEPFFLESVKGSRRLPRLARSRGGKAQQRRLCTHEIHTQQKAHCR